LHGEELLALYASSEIIGLTNQGEYGGRFR